MEDKIAVHCKTEEEWNRVVSKLGPKLTGSYPWKSSRSDACISTDGSGYGGIGLQTEEGYTIISAADYLKEGEVEEFKKGDRVELTEVKGSLKIGGQGSIVGFDGDLPEIAWDEYHKSNHNCGGLCKNGHGWNVRQEALKLMEN